MLPMRSMGLGALSLLSFVVELVTIEPGVSRPCYARRLNFHVRLVCAHNPNSPAGVASAPFWGGVGWGGTSASPNFSSTASAAAYFAFASACRRFASCIASCACVIASLALRFSSASTAAVSAFALSASLRSPHAARRHRATHSPLLRLS